MKQYDFSDKSNQSHVIGLGFFDCMHLGHRHLLEKVRQFGQKHNAAVTLSTFRNNFADALGRQHKLIYTYDERVAIMRQLGVDAVISTEFSRQFSCLNSQQFLTLLLRFNPKALICGDDYTFGCDRAGATMLEKFCEVAGIDCYVVEKYEYNGLTVSTTAIKNLLEKQDIEQANNLLGSDYFITGQVVPGYGEGRKLGFPTANLAVPLTKLLPQGVFCGHTEVDGKSYKTLLSIGDRPTFSAHTQSVEAHLIGLNQDLYGHILRVYLTNFLRKNVKFDSVEQLKAQLNKDKDYVENKIWTQR